MNGLRPDPSAPYDVAAGLPAGTDLTPYEAAGATYGRSRLHTASVRFT